MHFEFDVIGEFWNLVCAKIQIFLVLKFLWYFIQFMGNDIV